MFTDLATLQHTTHKLIMINDKNEVKQKQRQNEKGKNIKNEIEELWGSDL